MEPPQKGRNHALPWFGRPVSEMALTTGGKGKGKLGRKPGQKGKGKGVKDPAEAGGSVATKREAAKAVGRKGPTNGITEGSSGSCRRHARREKQPGQRLMAVYPQRSRTLEMQETNRRKSGVTPDGNQQTKRGKGEAQAPEEFQSNGVLSRSAGTPG